MDTGLVPELHQGQHPSTMGTGWDGDGAQCPYRWF